MGREYWDMFDVACGECELIEFLLTRFDAHDLKSKISISTSHRVEEQFAPPDPDAPQAPQVPQAQAPAQAQLYPIGDLHIKTASEPQSPDSSDSFVKTAPPPAQTHDLYQPLDEEEEEDPPQQDDPFSVFLAARQRHLQQNDSE